MMFFSVQHDVYPDNDELTIRLLKLYCYSVKFFFFAEC